LGIQETVRSNVDDLLAAAWSTRDGTVVPTTDSVVMKNGAVVVDATYLYADLANSSKAAHVLKKEVTAKIFRVYLNAATRIIRHYGGEIRSFDGDRVMGIFIGESKNTNAAKAGLGINWAVSEVIKPKLAAKWADLSSNWAIGHGVGVDTGQAFIARGGVRDNNDLISIGSAPNVAAKLSSLRTGFQTYVTKAVYDSMNESAKLSSASENMWTSTNSESIGGKTFSVYGSKWWMSPQ
jgi:adenylate cyclase